METSVPETKGGESLALRREAYKAVSGRVPLLLSIVLALLAGTLIGYGVRAFAVERDDRAPVVRTMRLPCLVVPPTVSIGRPRIILLGEARPVEPPAVNRSEAPAKTPTEPPAELPPAP